MMQTEESVSSSATPGEAADSQLNLRVETDMTALMSMCRQWDAFVARSGGDIYFTYDWCDTWWRHYGQGRDLRVLVFEQHDQLVGLLPLVIDRLWLGPVRIRLAKLLGSDSTTVVLNPPVLPEFAEEIYRRALQYMLQDQRCDAIRLGPLSGTRLHRQQIREACQRLPGRVDLIQDEEQTVHTVFHLPNTYDGYLASLEKDYRGMVRRERRTFEKQCQPTIDLIDDPAELGPAFEEFVTLHQAQWAAQNKLGHFGDMPHSQEFNYDLIARMGVQGRVWLLRIRVDGRVVACEYAFVFAGGLYWRLPARQVGETWERLSLGRVSLAYLIEAAIADGVTWIEGGAGQYPYKRRLGAAELPVSSMLIAADRPSSRLKAKMLRRFSDILHFLYYRIWFSRVGPALPLPRRPLWRTWIRSRV